MTTAIDLRPTKLTCGDEHLPATYNPWSDRTWCICGFEQWDGVTPTVWISSPRYDHAARGAVLLGWDPYEMTVTA